jgi:3-phosphoshikimate 1-carboxyvinyltransferase
LPVASAQVKSAMLLAGLYADGPVTVIEPAATRDHTERLLNALGVSIRRVGHAITLEPPPHALAAPARFTIPGDLSSAAFFIVAAAILPHSQLVVHDVGLNPTRMHFLEVLKRMGAWVRWDIQEDEWEPRGTLTIEHRSLQGIVVTASEVPLIIDELPIVMVAACAADGETRFQGLEELRVKETDRLRAMVAGLTRLGAHLERRGNAGITIMRSRLRGASVDSAQDHRTAMSLAIAGLLAEGQTRIRGSECVAKSLGNFFELLAAVTGPSTVKLIGGD